MLYEFGQLYRCFVVPLCNQLYSLKDFEALMNVLIMHDLRISIIIDVLASFANIQALVEGLI